MWSLNEFETKVKSADKNVRRASEGGRYFGMLSTTSLESIWAALEQNQSAEVVINGIKELSIDKQRKYYEALKYVLLNYRMDERIPTILQRLKRDQARLRQFGIPSGLRFSDIYRPEDGDLIYGIQGGRTQSPYRHRNLDFGSYHRYCDNFNNHLGIGGNSAFLHYRDSWTFKQSRFNNFIKNRATTSDAPARTKAFYDVLVDSRFAPDTVFGLSAEAVKDNQRGSSTLLERQHLESIRRACKAGFLTVATHPSFVKGAAKIHFILDCLGDLSDLALKKPLSQRSPYVPITTSELSFCFRKWRLPPLNLHKVVKFYVNGKEVAPPWEDDWTMNDATGREVKSGYVAWQRYRIYREVLRIPHSLTHDVHDMIRPGTKKYF